MRIPGHDMTNECRLAARLLAERQTKSTCSTAPGILAAANRLHCGNLMSPMGRFWLRSTDSAVDENYTRRSLEQDREVLAFVCMTCRTMHYELPIVATHEVKVPDEIPHEP